MHAVPVPLPLGRNTTVDQDIWLGTCRSQERLCIRSTTLFQLSWYGWSSRYASRTHSFRCSALTLEGPGDFSFLSPLIASAISSGSGTTSSISKEATNIGSQSGGKEFEYSLIRSFVTFWRSSQDGRRGQSCTEINQRRMTFHASLILCRGSDCYCCYCWGTITRGGTWMSRFCCAMCWSCCWWGARTGGGIWVNGCCCWSNKDTTPTSGGTWVKYGCCCCAFFILRCCFCCTQTTRACCSCCTRCWSCCCCCTCCCTRWRRCCCCFTCSLLLLIIIIFIVS